LLLFLIVSLVNGQARTFTLQNSCSETIWFLVTSGAAPTSTGSGSCPSVSCIEGATCNTQNGICYWDIPTPGNGNFRIDPGTSNTLTFPYYNNGQAALWSGNIGACLTGTCSDTNATCDSQGCGVINAAPMTRAEFTLIVSNADTYDVEVINGFNLPLSFGPDGTTYGTTTSNPYICGSPGAFSPSTGTASSTWNFSPPSIYYNWVISNGASCSASSPNCASGTCGLSLTNGQLEFSCGQLVGYWTANQICGVDSGYGTPISCQQSSTSNPGLVLEDLYGCTNAIPSCYSNGAPSSCCGCENWASVGISEPSNTQNCTNTNSEWLQYVEPGLVWLKQGAPNVYTFPYDDISSTFTCSNAAGGSTNSLNYEIVWCPEGTSTYPNTQTTTGSTTSNTQTVTGSNSQTTAETGINSGLKSFNPTYSLILIVTLALLMKFF